MTDPTSPSTGAGGLSDALDRLNARINTGLGEGLLAASRWRDALIDAGAMVDDLINELPDEPVAALGAGPDLAGLREARAKVKTAIGRAKSARPQDRDLIVLLDEARDQIDGALGATSTGESLDAAGTCEFVPPHEPWSCRTHNGVRTSLDETRCDIARPAEPLNDAHLDNIRRGIAEGRNPGSRYVVRRLLATIDADRAALGATPSDPEPPALDAPVITEDPEANGDLDDLFVRGGIESFHVERMDTGHWWFAVYLNDGTRLNFNFHSSRKITARYEREEVRSHVSIDTDMTSDSTLTGGR